MKKIKILYTIPNFDTAGSGVPLLKTATRLDKDIFEPHIACLHNRGELYKQVEKSKIKIYLIDIYKNARPIFKMLYECYKLSKIFKQINPDIIHSYHYGSDYTEVIAAKIAGIKWIYTKKNMSWKGPSYRSWKLRSWLSNGIIYQNTDMKTLFFPKTKKARLIPIGVDLSSFKHNIKDNSVKKKWNIMRQTRVIISVANLIPVKGIEILIKAFKLVLLEFPDWKLMIVGDYRSIYGKQLMNQVMDEESLYDKVIFTGKQKNVKQFLDISEIYVQPSLSKGEGAPVAVLEAMANGKVVLGSDVPGIRDQLKKFPDSLFIADNINDLKNKLVHYMSNEIDKNILIGSKFMNFAMDNYNLNIEREALQKFYLELIK